MPELPEVETIKKSLLSDLTGDRISRVEIYFPGMLQNMSPEDFKESVISNQIKDVKRRGKYLLIYVSCNGKMKDQVKVIIIHLRMTGRLILKNNEVEKSHNHLDDEEIIQEYRHLRCLFQLQSGITLEFHDQRKFGTMALVNQGEEFYWKGLANLGPEPLSEEFDYEDFYKGVKKSKKPIKGILLDQKLVAGIGNIYADEVLFASGIHPARKGEELTEQEVGSLYKTIIQILELGIKYRGTTFSDYRDSEGNKGNFQDLLKVFNRNKEECLICRREVQKTKVANRGTYYCPNCQPL
ncbi:DNA-formamidopyrimidine glycosylase [Natranaerobius thermophilus]|uniref:Formamidopyrimidine-DNA glycosylase n=1 Tax=Natranaerobius thermophilus (strain ATCC BAA-1301 / DSM 18059 / JW/NM-WN-LF) TaxID=457570 RepID=B2A645_NATTJ|nr:DNA-formamidopyrimidine glycosylase [Natranaerobius thermophilus]ACB85462.1 formamidopyrimidine-DNA glycosylase [Natranaerobius thermophilus JW/NM-WN-LF]